MLDELVDDVDGLEFDLIEDLRSELRRGHAWQVTHGHVHQLGRIAAEEGAEGFA